MKKFLHKYAKPAVILYYAGQWFFYLILLLLAVAIATPLAKLLFIYAKFFWELI